MRNRPELLEIDFDQIPKEDRLEALDQVERERGPLQCGQMPEQQETEMALVARESEAQLMELMALCTAPHPESKRVRRLSFREAEKQAGRPPSSIIDRPNGEREFVFVQPEAAKEAAPAEEPPRTFRFKARPKQKVVL
jgi:hypothetical protein